MLSHHELSASPSDKPEGEPKGSLPPLQTELGPTQVDEERLRQRIEHLQLELRQARLDRQQTLVAYQDLLARSLPISDLKGHTACGYVVLDARGRLIDCNDTALRWLAYTRQEVLGRLHWRRLLGPVQRRALLHPWRTLMRQGRLSDLELRLLGNGVTLDALVNAVMQRDAWGRPACVQVSLVDISARKLGQQDQPDWPLLQALADQFPEPLSYWDGESRLRYANRAFAATRSRSFQQLRGCAMAEALDPSLHASMQESVQAVLTGQACSMESAEVVRNHSRRLQQRLVPDIRNGLVVGYFLWSRDVTGLRRGSGELRGSRDELDGVIQHQARQLYESEERLRLMADGVEDYCIYFLDMDGLICDWTVSAERLHCCPPGDVMGQHFSMFCMEDETSRQSADRLLRIARARGQSERRGWAYRKDGSRLWAHAVITALRDDDGQLRGFSHIMHDMSEIKRAEDMQLNLQAELEQRVKDRTRELEAANRDLEAFSYSVSHDLRAPLRHITGFIELLKGHCPPEALDETALKYLGTITQAAQTMSQLIDGLLSFSRLGRATVNRSVVDFDSVVHGLQAMLQAHSGQRLIEWQIGDLPTVRGDAVLLREVWSNLLDNAVKYTRHQPVTHIRIGCLPATDDEQTFFVRDNGIGFDAQAASRLFGVFQRLHNAREFEGTGIGLALVQRIVERHGGRVWAESEVGVGSSFYFCLPVAPATRPAFDTL